MMEELKVMEFRIIFLPPFMAVSSGVDGNCDFSSKGILGKFNKYISNIQQKPMYNQIPNDLLFYDPIGKGMVWWYVLTDEIIDKEYEIVDFEGGYYLVYSYIYGDEDMKKLMLAEARKYIKESKIFELDERDNHYIMGHIITPDEIVEMQGWAQVEVFIPIKITKK